MISIPSPGPLWLSFTDFKPHPDSSTILSGHMHTIYGGHLELYSKLKDHYSSMAVFDKAMARDIDEGNSLSLPETRSRAMLRAYLGQDWTSTIQGQDNAALQRAENVVVFQTLDDFSLAFSKFVVKSSVAVLSRELPDARPSDIDFRRVTKVFIQEIADNQPCTEPPLEKTVLGDTLEGKESDTSISLKPEKDNSETRASWCLGHKTYDIGSRHEFERFKKFITGTVGERYWLLWIDIERLKVLKDPMRQKRGPRFCVTHTHAIEAASAKLKIWHSRQQKPRLDVDPFPQMVSLLPLRAKSCMPRMSHQQKSTIRSLSPLTKAVMPSTFYQKPTRLLSAVLPRSQSAVREDCDAWSRLTVVSPKRPATACDNMTRLTTVPDKTDYLKPQLNRKYTYAEVIPGKMSPDICELGSSKMERMLQCLNTENRAGYVFTEFCEKSENKLWKNSAYFWFDLQDYHQLFYQETLHPYKLCKQAQAEPGGDSRALPKEYK
uniref:Uncharacterized protein n=1 Tax=Sphaerodactylus townsendi TaxID=933632 RepID=A0ACB8FER0_9SAUR